MGKRLRGQRRGTGTPAYKSPSHRFKVDLKYRPVSEQEKQGVLKGQVVDFLDDPAHKSILMKVLYEDGKEYYLIAPEGMLLGREFQQGKQASLNVGNVLPLSEVPEGSYIYNLELKPGDGGKLVRAPGSYAYLVSKDKGIAYVKLPSKKTIEVKLNCRAQLGIINGGGFSELPMMKAGKNFYKMRALNRMWPTLRGVKMSAYNHPHGGKQHHIGHSSCTSKGAPPGRKVGHIGARVTGRKKSRTKV